MELFKKGEDYKKDEAYFMSFGIHHVFNEDGGHLNQD
jgi:hypothetical protein